MNQSTAHNQTDSAAADAAFVGKPSQPRWFEEAFALLLLALLAVYFLKISWRKWPDPIVDSGPQLYAAWQVSEGALPYHAFTWNYGPFSLCFNALLFKIFGPGLMVLVTANLIFYALIVGLMYVAFRKAWGRAGAFAALAVFISVFSFSHLLAVGNYNFVTPYAAEASHGMLLILGATFIVARWYRKESRKLAFLLGLCGGVAVVMKPEFMLADGVLGIAALVLRWRHRVPVTMGEFLCIAAGLVLPTLAFAAWFARVEPLKQAFIDASQAWWVVLVTQFQKGNLQQASFLGFNNPWANALKELRCTGWALIALTAIWAAGWFVNRSWSWTIRLVTAAAAIALASRVRLENGWTSVGLCLPGLMVLACLIAAVRIVREFRGSRSISERNVMMLALILLGVAMLARMPLRARISHLGFFQAALAGMVVAAMMISELPRWTGAGRLGRSVAAAASFAALGVVCGSIAMRSAQIRADQTQEVGRGRDRFYSTQRLIDGTGALVNWAAERMRLLPPDAEVLVLPEGEMINYLSRHKAPESGVLRESEDKFVEQLRRKPPEYVVLISRDLKEFGMTRYGAPGNPGYALVPWIGENYKSEAWLGGDPLDPNGSVGAVIMRRKDLPAPAVLNTTRPK